MGSCDSQVALLEARGGISAGKVERNGLLTMIMDVFQLIQNLQGTYVVSEARKWVIQGLVLSAFERLQTWRFCHLCATQTIIKNLFLHIEAEFLMLHIVSISVAPTVHI